VIANKLMTQSDFLARVDKKIFLFVAHSARIFPLSGNFSSRLISKTWHFWKNPDIDAHKV